MAIKQKLSSKQTPVIPNGTPLLSSTIITHHPQSNKQLLLIIAPDQITLDSLLLRASIYNEDSKYKSIYLSQQEFINVQVTNKKKFNYQGHNLPLNSLYAFLNLSASKNDTSLGEMHLLRTLSNPKLKLIQATHAQKQPLNLAKTTNVYVIGWIKGDVPTFTHELFHAWYFLDRAQYQSVCARTLNSLNNTLRLQVRAYLQGCGYCQDVFVDEFQAHLCCNDQMVLGDRGMLVMQPARSLLIQCINEGGGRTWFDNLNCVAHGVF